MPMTHEARQFHHILDMVDSLDEDFLRAKVKHLPLFIAAQSFERERLYRVTIATAQLNNEHLVGIYQLANTYYGLANNINNSNPMERHRANTTTVKNINRKRQLKIGSHPRDRSISTSEYLLINKETNQITPAHLGSIPGEIVSANNDPSEGDVANSTLDSSNLLLLHSTPYLVDEYDRIDDFNNHTASTSSGSGPVKRRWGPRKSPNSRIAHNMNEKNRRADLRESLENLKLALPQFKQKSCKSTTSDILQFGYKYITDGIAMHKNMLEQRINLFETSKSYKLKICQLILENNVQVLCPSNLDDTRASGDKFAPTTTIPMDDTTKLIFHKYIEINVLMDVNCLYNLEFNQTLYPNLDYKAIEAARKKYLQTASISTSTGLLKSGFSLLQKTHLLPTNPLKYKNETINGSLSTSSKLLSRDTNMETMDMYGSSLMAQPYRSRKRNTKYNHMDEQFPASVYTRASSPLASYTMATMPNNQPFYRQQQQQQPQQYSFEELPNVDSPNKSSTATTSINSSSTVSVVAGTTPIIPPITATESSATTATTTDFINTSRSSYSSNQQSIAISANISANISDEDTNLNTTFYDECVAASRNPTLNSENSFSQSIIGIDSKNDHRQSSTKSTTETLNISSLMNSNSKSSG